MGAMIPILNSCGATSEKEPKTTQETVQSLKHEQLLERISSDNDTLYLVNFWATWCVPCVEELPEFLAVNRKYSADHAFKLLLVSLDFAKNIDSLVIPFIHDQKVDAEVVLLDDSKRMNTWIPLFDKSWSGAIPATTLYKNGQKLFFKEGIMDETELNDLINKHL